MQRGGGLGVAGPIWGLEHAAGHAGLCVNFVPAHSRRQRSGGRLARPQVSPQAERQEGKHQVGARARCQLQQHQESEGRA